MGGQIVCLTCSRCNNGGSRLDRAASREKKAVSDYVSGRGTEIEVSLFGVKRSGFLQPEEGREIRLPIPTKVGQLRGTMQIRSLPSGSELDVNKGIGTRIKRPESIHVTVSLLRSAYLLVFSLLGTYGYRYAESAAICKIREQIMNPEETIVDARVGTVSGLDEGQVLISFQFGQKPFFWSVKIDNRAVLLPCGGALAELHTLAKVASNTDMKQETFGHWLPAQFGNAVLIVSTIRGENDVPDGELIGTRGASAMDGRHWEWVMVDHQGRKTAALPLGSSNSEAGERGIEAVVMLGENEVRGRGLDRSKFTKVGRS